MIYRILLAAALVQGYIYADDPSDKKLTKDKYLYELAVVAMFQNEAPYMKEWIEFHKLVGVQHFYLYNNLSTDDYLTVLQPYIEKGEVNLTDWPYDFGPIREWRQIQSGAYNDTIEKVRGKVHWLAVIDLDEFVFPVKGTNLVKLLKDYSDFGGVIATWQMYGTSHVEQIPEGDLMIEHLLLKANEDYHQTNGYKSIIQPHCVKGFGGTAHFPSYLPGYFAVDSNKVPFNHKQPHGADIDKLRINHYWCRDEEFFRNIKLPRAKRRHMRADWQDYADHLNGVADDAIFKYIPALKRAMGFDLQRRS